MKSASINKVTLKGRLGKDSEQRTFESGDTVVRFSLATTDLYTDRNGEPRKKTEWHRISVYDQTLTETCMRLKKGDLVQVDGKLETRDYEKDGQKHYATEICVRPGHSVKLFSGEAPRQ
jgi:single-strand DNA-binding protein